MNGFLGFGILSIIFIIKKSPKIHEHLRIPKLNILDLNINIFAILTKISWSNIHLVFWSTLSCLNHQSILIKEESYLYLYRQNLTIHIKNNKKLIIIDNFYISTIIWGGAGLHKSSCSLLYEESLPCREASWNGAINFVFVLICYVWDFYFLIRASCSFLKVSCWLIGTIHSFL